MVLWANNFCYYDDEKIIVFVIKTPGILIVPTFLCDLLLIMCYFIIFRQCVISIYAFLHK